MTDAEYTSRRKTLRETQELITYLGNRIKQEKRWNDGGMDSRNLIESLESRLRKAGRAAIVADLNLYGG